jgi:hypothetical protein
MGSFPLSFERMVPSGGLMLVFQHPAMFFLPAKQPDNQTFSGSPEPFLR